MCFMQACCVFETYLANTFTSTTPGGLEHTRVLDLVATSQGLLHGVHTRTPINIGRDAAPALLVRQADIRATPGQSGDACCLRQDGRTNL